MNPILRHIVNKGCHELPHLLRRVQQFLLLAVLLLSAISTRAQQLSDSIKKVVDLNEVTVFAKKERYSKRNNPAVELMERVRQAAQKGNPNQEPFYSFDKYSKISIGLADFNTPDKESPNSYISDYVDTEWAEGSEVLRVSLKETASKAIRRKSPHSRKEIVTGRRNEGIDNAFNQDNIYKALEDVLREVDIYGNDVAIMQNRFVSPLANIGADFYKYFITDTLNVEGTRCIAVAFTPRNPESLGFSGQLFVAADDTTGFIKKVRMRVPSVANINYIDRLTISQTFEKDSLGNRNKTDDRMSVVLQLVAGTQRFLAERSTAYSNFSYNEQTELAEYYPKAGRTFYLDGFDEQTDEFWDEARKIPLTGGERNLGSLLMRLRHNKWFNWSEKLLKIIVEGYITTGKKSKVDIGPVNTLVSYNSLEGVRFRVGGVTTANLSKHWFARGYLAYGLRDRKFKYLGEVEYSFLPKKKYAYDFPVNSIRATHQYDVDMLGQHYLFTNPDNIFISVRRKKSDLATYRRLSELTYTLELENNFSFVAALRYETQQESPFIKFVNGNNRSFNHYNQSSLRLTFRYSPGETFIEGHTMRQLINSDAPLIMLTHEIGPQGWLGSEFFMNKTELVASKRFRLSWLGYADVTLKGGILWNRVQFPALLWPNANLSYTVQPESYSLMNPMEFANDRYASIDLSYWLNGLILNRIPFINRARLREVFTFKSLWGGLSRKNDPAYNPSLFRFPLDADTHRMTSTPYMEIGVGLDNIFSILRVDYVWRLTYLNHPGINRSGLRIALHFSF